MNKTKSIICFIISIAVVLFLGYVVMFGVGGRHTGSAQNVTQGLDLMGGTSVSYQVDESKTKSFTATDLEDTRLKLENRVHTFSSEATAYKEGDDRITVDIPGEYDADAVVVHQLGCLSGNTECHFFFLTAGSRHTGISAASHRIQYHDPVIEFLGADIIDP